MQVVTFDATPAAGAHMDCVTKTRAAFAEVLEEGRSSNGRARLAQTFGLCQVPEDEAGTEDLAYWLQVIWRACVA